jgi:ParB family chromosome partitioning protein
MTTIAHALDFQRIPIASIDAPELPSRSTMDDQKMDELIESIRSIGLQQPLGVFPDGARYQVVFGHRRRIACERAGLTEVVCRVYPSADIPRFEIQLSENLEREDLSPADEATWFYDLLHQKCGGDIEKLATLVRKKIGYVDGRLQLALGYPDVFAALKAGEIQIGVAHELNTITSDHYRNHYLRSAVRSGATVATVTGWVAEWKGLHSLGALPEPGAAAEPSIAGSPQENFLTCFLCGKTNHTHTMQQLVVHGHCRLAILDPLLEEARQR